MNTLKSLAGAAIAVAMLAAPAAAAPAAPAQSLLETAKEGSAMTQVHRRRGGGWGPGLGIGLGIIGGAIIANELSRPRRGYYYDDYDYRGPYTYPSGYSGDARSLCAQNFRSFEWSTGLYTTYSGERRLCPYLR